MAEENQIIAIGRIKPEFYYETPTFAFIVIKKPDGIYVSTCLHLLIDGYGLKEENAIEDMKEAITNFLQSNFEKLSIEDAWSNLRDLAHATNYSSPLWNIYRDAQFDLAEKGITDSIGCLNRRIIRLKKQIKQLKKENKNLIKRSIEDAIFSTIPSVTAYKQLEIV